LPLYIRATVLEAETVKEPFAVLIDIALVHRPPWRHSGSVTAEKLTLNEPSQWLDLSKVLHGESGEATCVFKVVTGGAPSKGRVKVKLDLARQKDAREPLASITVEDPGGVAGFVMPARGVEDAQIPRRFKSLLDVSRAHLDATKDFGLSAEERPKRFAAATACIIDSQYTTDPRVARNEIETVLRLGYNTLSHAHMLDEYKVPFSASGQYRPPPLEQMNSDDKARESFGRRAPSEFGRLKLFALSDEPNWDFPAASDRLSLPPDQFASYPTDKNDGKLRPAADNLEKFRRFLQDKGLTPAEFGQPSWDQVRPGFAPLTNDSTLPQRKQWYWTIKYLNHEQCQWYATAAKAVARARGDDVLTFTNWNNPGIFYSDCLGMHPDQALLTASHEWFEFARAGGGSCLWLGPGISESGGSTLRTWSMMLNLLRSAASEGPQKFGAYVHHNFIANDRGDDIELSIMSLAGHGGVAYNSYIWGPHYAMTEYMWSEKFGHYQAVAESNRLIARAEDLLLAGKAPQAKIALLWPIASQMHDLNRRGYWSYNRDFLVEMQHIYFALSHRGYPVKFIDDAMIQRGDLSSYDILYVTGPNLETKTAASISAWVNSGGALWTCAGVGTLDEYGMPATALDQVLGITDRSVKRPDAADGNARGRRERRFAAMGQVQMLPGGNMGDKLWRAYGSRESLKLAGGQAIGRFDENDSAPAVVRNAFGKGVSLHFAAMPGLSYGAEATVERGAPLINYPQHIGDLIAWFAESKQIRRPVTTDFPFVEALLLESDKGATVTLLNWSRQPLAKVQVCLDNAARYGPARSARLGQSDLAQKIDGDAVVVTLPMPRVADVLIFPAR
jgi:hypothetical protein